VNNLLFEIPLSKEDNLLQRFEEIQDYIYSHDGLSPQQALEEFIKILFIKIIDENESNSLFTEDRINELFEKTKQNYPDIFEKDEYIKLSNITVTFIIDKLQDISLIDSTQDASGLAFQKFLSHHEKDHQGQFFTPEPVIRFCVEMMRPQANEKIIDPTCGSGGFLLSALSFLKDENINVDKQYLISENIFGFDINKSILRIAKMKLLLEANVKLNLSCNNSLCNMEQLSNVFDLVLTNPPFGAKISNSDILSKFDLGYKWMQNGEIFTKTKQLLSTQNTEILFIELCLRLLKEGGRMGIVLPNGNLENPSLEYLRYYIRQHSRLLAIVKLPAETFIPYGTGVKTSILFVEKDTNQNSTHYPIFLAKVTKLGYQGNKNGTPVYKKNHLGQLFYRENISIIDEDFSEIVVQYKNFQNNVKLTNNNTLSLQSNELKGRFDFDFYTPENKVFANSLNNGKLVKLGELCDIVKVKSQKLKNVNQTVEYIELSDINTQAFEIINTTSYLVHELPSRASYELKEGDIITAIAGNSVGTRKHATAYVTKEFEGCICTNGFRVLRNFKVDPYYLLYFFHTNELLKQMYMYRTGAAIPNVSDNDLANIDVYIPTNGKKEEISRQIKNILEMKQLINTEMSNITLDFD